MATTWWYRSTTSFCVEFDRCDNRVFCDSAWPLSQSGRIKHRQNICLSPEKKSGKKVKASHTRYRALGPELIPVYRQSACR